jgi:hypothetical protein
MSDRLATDIRAIVDDGAPPITLAELELASLTGTPPRPRRRWPVLAAVAAAAALVVATIVLVRTESGNGGNVLTPAGPAPSAATPGPSTPSPSTRPPLPDGLTALPSAGATPSAPETGQLLAPLPIPIWVYEDGRVISARWTSPDHWTGFLEQRLSPSGVELVRAEILALEPFPDCGAGMGNYGYADGARIVGESPGATDLCGAAFARLADLAYGAPSWLPASAWLDPDPKPFVPVRYDLEIDHFSSVPSPVDVTALLATVAPEVGKFLTRPSQCRFGDMSAFATCFEVSTDEARDLAAALDIPPPPNSLRGHFKTRDRAYVMEFVPYLPHDTPVWCCGG